MICGHFFVLLKRTDCPVVLPAGMLPERVHQACALMAALLPVAVHLDIVANRMVMIVGVGRGDDANGDSGERERKQNFLHGGFLGRTDLVD